MKNIFKKALSFFLAVIMTVGMFPISVFATEAEKDFVYISVSYDDKFIQNKDGGFMTNVEVPLSAVAAVDLTTYGLGEYLYDEDEDGQYDITALQLIIYAHENIYGGDWDDVSFQVFLHYYSVYISIGKYWVEEFLNIIWNTISLC